jgi:hypothetical protein
MYARGVPPGNMKKGSRATTFFAIIHLIQYTQKTQTLAAIKKANSFYLIPFFFLSAFQIQSF